MGSPQVFRGEKTSGYSHIQHRYKGGCGRQSEALMSHCRAHPWWWSLLWSPKPICLPQGPMSSWSSSPSSTIQAWVAGPLRLHAHPLLSKPVVGPEWWWMGSSSFNTHPRQLISISEAWGGGGEWWTQWFPTISGPGIPFIIYPFHQSHLLLWKVLCIKQTIFIKK